MLHVCIYIYIERERDTSGSPWIAMLMLEAPRAVVRAQLLM